MDRSDLAHLARSALHNLGVTIVAFGVGFLGVGVDHLLGIREFRSLVTVLAGALLMKIGFLLRLWATFHFYRVGMKVISLVPQKTLVTTGPFRFSRNPLYLGGNVFSFLGAALVLGSPSAIGITLVHLPFLDWMIRREERQLEKIFGEAWVRYRSTVRRWV
jgi:protein-S-isoprenylcysteine O-methyltransferase Ste14